MFRSATFKLTMWYLAIVMTISLVFSGVVYNIATSELSRSLHHETERFYSQFPLAQGDPLLQSSADYESGAHSILLRLIGVNIIVLVGAGYASYWLARRTLEPIEEAHEQQKRFTADVSHELRTPLTALRMESEVALLNNKNGKKELQATLSSNLEEVSKLETLINNLLRLTRLEVGEIQQQATKLDNKALLSAAIKQVKKAADEHGIKINKDIQEASFMGDRGSLQQLLVILLDNAIKYSPSGSTIHLSSHATGEYVTFVVQDEGIGIEKEALGHVFDRFYRGSNASRSKAHTEGFGLGLSIAKMIIDIHHGSIKLSSRLKLGTTATVSLPIEEPTSAS